MDLRIDTENYRPSQHGIIFLQCIVALFFCTFATRFWYLQIHKGDEFSKKSIKNIQRFEYIYSNRGRITDSKNRILAENIPSFALALNRDECNDINATLAQVSAWTGADLNEIIKKYHIDVARANPFDSIIVCPEITQKQLALISAELVYWPGLKIITRNQRYYPYKNLFSHIIGYIAEANQQELKSDHDLALGESIGKLGLEKKFESTLRGEKGKIILEVDVLGRVLSRNVLVNPANGKNISLTIDSELQRAIYEIIGDQAGSIVIMDPNTGKIKALVSNPTYDNNPFVEGISQKDWDALRNSPYYPMQNRAIQSAYPPGSIWKLIMAGLFLHKGIDPKERITCTGEITVSDQKFRCWNREGHGKVNMLRSIVESCDVYYYTLGERMGINRIEKYARAFGFGSKTGIDLPHENAGLVPSREWKEKRKKESWFKGDTINVSIGQGSLLTTPLQVAVFVSSIVNGGKIMKPQIVNDRKPEVVMRTPMTKEQCDFILNAMHQATKPSGTARAINRSNAIMGGKTGTAQVVKIRMIGDRRQSKEEMQYFERDHAWFASWGKFKGKDVVVVVMIEHGGGGGANAGPIAKKVYDVLFGPDPKEREKPEIKN